MVDTRFESFNTAISAFYTAVETANKAIQTSLNSTSKDDLSKRLGYKNYAAMEAAALAGETVINNGKINTVLIEAAAVVAEGISAKIIEALDIVTSRLTVTDGAKIGDYSIENGGISAVFTNWNEVPKLLLMNAKTYREGSKYFSMGLSARLSAKNSRITPNSEIIESVPGNSSLKYLKFSRVHNICSDCEVVSDKKTTMVIESLGAAKGNTALALIGALQVTGGVSTLENFGQESFLSEGVPKYRRIVFTKTNQTVYLPSTDDILAYFGKMPEITGEGTTLGSDPFSGAECSWFTFELFRVPWASGSTTVKGNASGNGDTTLISGTPLYSGKDQYTFGQFVLNPGEYAIVSLISRRWYVLYKGKGW